MRISFIKFTFRVVLAFLSQLVQLGDLGIISPHPGDVLQGTVTIRGSSDLDGFISAEVAFTYADDQTGSWFQIATNDQPVFNDSLATWDTTVITDGNYVIRLRVYLADGSFSEAFSSGLRVRNYTRVETPTPIPTVPEATPIPTITPTATPFPTPTPLPPNPATLPPGIVSASVLFGGLAVILILGITGIYLWLRKKLI